MIVKIKIWRNETKKIKGVGSQLLIQDKKGESRKLTSNTILSFVKKYNIYITK